MSCRVRSSHSASSPTARSARRAGDQTKTQGREPHDPCHDDRRRTLLGEQRRLRSRRAWRTPPTRSPAPRSPGFGETVTGKKKQGQWRIGFSNGFSGNSWRAMCLAAMQAGSRRAQGRRIADLIIGRRPGRHSQAGQRHRGADRPAGRCDPDASPNSGSAVVNVLRERDQGAASSPCRSTSRSMARSGAPTPAPTRPRRAARTRRVAGESAERHRQDRRPRRPARAIPTPRPAGPARRRAFKGTKIEVLAIKDASLGGRSCESGHGRPDRRLSGNRRRLWCDGAQDASAREGAAGGRPAAGAAAPATTTTGC